MTIMLPNGHTQESMPLAEMQDIATNAIFNLAEQDAKEQSIITAESKYVEVSKPKDGIYELCNSRREKLLPFLNNNNMHFEKLARSFAWEINTNDKLKSCSQISMVQAFYKCCEYGLDPAASLGQAWM